MVALNTTYAAPKNAADPKNRVGDFFYEDRASVGKNRWAKRLNTQGKYSYHYETASGRSNWPSRDPLGERGWSKIGKNEKTFLEKTSLVNFKSLILVQLLADGLSYDTIVDFLSVIADVTEPTEAEFLVEGPNRYSAMANNPLVEVDILGLFLKHIKCWNEVRKWRNNCMDELPDCSDPCLDAEELLDCHIKRKEKIAECMAGASAMMEACLKANAGAPGKPGRM